MRAGTIAAASAAFCCCTAALALPHIPAPALQYFPRIKAESIDTLAGAIHPAILASQIHQETCASKSKCWNPHAELKTKLEHGIGLGQFTITKRFNKFKELQQMDPFLASWDWVRDPYNPRYQLRGLAVADRACFRFARDAAGQEKTAMALACYNGGGGGVSGDRHACRAKPGCDPNRWWNNVETTSAKSRVAKPGYGKSFFDINREYVRNILRLRLAMYQAYNWDALPKPS
jgi:hypothetical protein